MNTVRVFFLDPDSGKEVILTEVTRTNNISLDMIRLELVEDSFGINKKDNCLFLCPVHKNRELSKDGYCVDCGDYPLKQKKYSSCLVPIGVYCVKHGVVHSERRMEK